AREEMLAQNVAEPRISLIERVHLRYEGTDSALIVERGSRAEIVERFEQAYRQRYGFVMEDKPFVVEAVSVEAIGAADAAEDPLLERDPGRPTPGPRASRPMYAGGVWHDAPVYEREALQ